MDNNRKYGISAVSLWPWNVGEEGLMQSLKMAINAGYDGIQALPIRGWQEPSQVPQYLTDKGVSRVISFEKAWNVGPLWEAVMRMLHIFSDPAPTIRDWLIFGNRRSESFSQEFRMRLLDSGSIEVAHFWNGRTAVEIHPELTPEIQYYLDYIKYGGKVCFDTWHARRPDRRPERRTGKNIRDWRELLDALPKESIALIHVHPLIGEMREFLDGKGEITEILKALARKVPTNVPAIIEIRPVIRTFRGTIGHIEHVLKATKDAFES